MIHYLCFKGKGNERDCQLPGGILSARGWDAAGREDLLARLQLGEGCGLGGHGLDQRGSRSPPVGKVGPFFNLNSAYQRNRPEI